MMSDLGTSTTPTISAPPEEYQSQAEPTHGTAPESPILHRDASMVITMRGYLEEVGHLARLHPKDAWLPITESRKGNALYAAFHTLCAGLGTQALLLPVAFSFLGWETGISCLVVAFLWQLYTFWILTELHEAVPGTRYSRYVDLAQVAFGDKLGNLLAKFPIAFLSAGTCITLTAIGGSSMKLFYKIVCGPECSRSLPALSTIEWYLVFTCLAVILSHLPNLNSIACVSLVGAVAAVAYCTVIWVVSVALGRPPNISYDPIQPKSDVPRVFGVINALAIIVFAFRGHNLTLEIQGTLPSSPKQTSDVPMWKGVKFAYLVVALCVFPVAIGGFWAYGNSIPPTGALTAFYGIHGRDVSAPTLGVTSLLVVISCLSTYQIYAMPMFDDMEAVYACKKSKRCPWWLRSCLRTFFGAISFFLAIAFPFLASLSGLIGGLTLPVTLVYPCFMWIMIKKPEKHSAMWYVNWGLGCLGVALTITFVAGGVWSIIHPGIKFKFFKPE